MLVKRLVTYTVVTLTFLTKSFAQNQFNTGFIGGANYSFIDNVDHIIISEPYFINGINYTLTNKRVPGFDFGAFINTEYNANSVGEASGFFNFEVRYSGNSTELNFNNSQDFNYKMRFNYQYVNFVLEAGGGFNKIKGGLGIQFSLNAASHNIAYRSFGEGKRDEFGTDLAQQQQIRGALYGKSNFGVLAKLGYEISNQLDVELRYNLGLKNIVEVKPNSYNFIQQTNHSNSFSLLFKFYIRERKFRASNP